MPGGTLGGRKDFSAPYTACGPSRGEGVPVVLANRVRIFSVPGSRNSE